MGSKFEYLEGYFQGLLVTLSVIGLASYLVYQGSKHYKFERENETIKTEVTSDFNKNGLMDTYIEVNGKKYFSVFDGKKLESIVDKNKLEKD